ncbi:hypothetical protein [Streptomyces sp. G45]|uniref:hypothetical protein n=1 Tax=Streptomyces sp. G45 TaxID=3406627 RepID=UPI003C23B2A9
MNFRLDITLDPTAPADTTIRELGRILRYWAGNLHHYDLTPGTRETVTDSSYTPVGTWEITES